MELLAGKRALILGVANDHSLAWAIAREFHQQGATLALTHAGEAFERRVRPLAAEIGVELVWPCDVLDDSQVAALSQNLSSVWPQVDVLVHAIAFAQREDLKQDFSHTSRQGFRLALEVSTYSFVQLAQAFSGLLAPGSSLLTLTYFGAEKVIPNYNVMGVAKAALEACVRYLAAELGPRGVRVNAVSAGPVRTLSAAGIAGFREMLRHHAERAPLRRNVTPEEVAKAALFLASDLASGITGEVLHVDAGYNIMGF
ncbi:Enoyl-[acyl-carrier-protein] reductase [NADH] FabI [bacterium HR30]|nr:Enoyl-[acyl-carrier-protein] reductase [NADH] FabI [bacterium HR30]